jgi:hypothetical protein
MDVGGILGLILLTVLMDIEMCIPFYLASLAIFGNVLLYFVTLRPARLDPAPFPSTRVSHSNRIHDLSPEEEDENPR